MEKPTRGQILAEPAGRRLNGWVAEFVMGWVSSTCRSLFPDVNQWYIVGDEGEAVAPESDWSPSTNIAAAWQVVEWVEPHDHCHWQMMQECSGYRFVVVSDGDSPLESAQAQGETAPLAICRASLLAVLTAHA